MSATRLGRIQKATALIPLALLSAAATASISGVGFTQASADPSGGRLPDGTALPAEAIEAPASVSDGPIAAPGATDESATQIVSTASAASIPAAALAAYQRAETVINRADRTCHIPWQLIAAIGRVESNHGRANGSLLDADGIAQPDILGPALDGTAGTSAITDTDGGQFDGDTVSDRAVGPMQFIPSTWSTVGVDADGDGQRNPQDIDDSALAAAVYLCSGDDDLATEKGQSAAVYRYNHSASYVATVLAVMRAYQAGDFTAVPTATIPANYFAPDYSAIAASAGHHKHKRAKQRPGAASTRTPHAPSPTAPAAGDGGGRLPRPPHPDPTVTPPPTIKPPKVTLPTTGAEPVDDVLTVAEATTQCTLDLGVGKLNNALGLDLTQLLKLNGLLDDWNACIQKYTT